MATEDSWELTIEKLVAGGSGLAFKDGKAVFVPRALPGERVRVRPGQGRKDYAEARVLEVLEASPFRVEAPCPLYGDCGGCDLQHLAYPQQVSAKAAIVAEAFKRNAEAGMVMVNLPTAGVDYHVPFGGRKGSSYGPREQGRAHCQRHDEHSHDRRGLEASGLEQ